MMVTRVRLTVVEPDLVFVETSRLPLTSKRGIEGAPNRLDPRSARDLVRATRGASVEPGGRGAPGAAIG
jgi:hypothetical protein